jgi:hypothetical protein
MGHAARMAQRVVIFDSEILMGAQKITWYTES